MSNRMNSNVAFIHTQSDNQYVVYKPSPIGISRFDEYKIYAYNRLEQEVKYICEIKCPFVVGRYYSPYLYRTMALICLGIQQEMIIPNKDQTIGQARMDKLFILYKRMYDDGILDNNYSCVP